MKLSCNKCSKVFVVRNWEVKGFDNSDFICPNCRSPLKKTKTTGMMKVVFTSIKNLLTEDAINRSITRKLVRLYEKLQEVKANSLNLTIN